VVRVASEEVMASKGLALVLRQMLVIGNIMNEGSRKGQASGITLNSLLKLIHTKGADKKTTVLDYVINLCLDKVTEKINQCSRYFFFLCSTTLQQLFGCVVRRGPNCTPPIPSN
jgi:hypothetical protein